MNFGEWISINDHLPEKSSKIIVCFDAFGKPSIDIAAFIKYNNDYHEFLGVNEKYISHWMPLPKFPNK